MTISTILGLGARSSTTTSPGFHLGDLGHRPYAQHRGDVWVQSEGWKGGGNKKGDSAAISALTLLAFLFFLNILQSCLQDMTYQQPATVLMGQGAGGREEIPMVAMAMPAMPAMPMGTPMGTPMAGGMRSRRQAEEPPIGSGVELCDHCDAPQPGAKALQAQQRGWEVVPVVEPRRPPVHVQVRTKPPEERVVSITPAPMTRTGLGQPTSSVELYRLADLASSNAIASFSPARPIISPVTTSAPTTSTTAATSTTPSSSSEKVGAEADKQEEYALSAAPPRPLGALAVFPPTRVALVRPGGGGLVTFVPLGGALGGSMGSMGTVGSMAWRALSAVTRPLVQFMSPRLRSALCCELVLCEARRIARLRMTGPGGALAGAVSGVVSWACAATGGETDLDPEPDQGCRRHIEECDLRAGRRTAVSTIAALLEAYLSGGAGAG